MRRHNRDGNQAAVVELARAHGLSVAITSHVGDGFPDLVVGRRVSVKSLVERYGLSGSVPMNFLVELKNEARPPSARALRETEERFKSRWRGQYLVAKNFAEMASEVGIGIPSI